MIDPLNPFIKITFEHIPELTARNAIEPALIPRPCHGTRNHSPCPIFCIILEKMHLPHCILLADKVLLPDWISGIRLI